MTNELPSAFAVWFKDISRWDPSSVHAISWHWPTETMKPLGSVLKIRKEKANRVDFAFKDLQPITIHFNGSLDRRKVDPVRAYTMDLFFARPGDIVVAKIDLKNGAVGFVPAGWENVVVTNHFAVYEPDLSQIVPQYLLLLIQTRFFKAHLNRNKVGAEGRKEVKLDFFEMQLIPLPPLPIQQAIVARWEAAQAEVGAIRTQFVDMEGVISWLVLDSLGIPAQEFRAMPKAFALEWKDMERWSVEFLSRTALETNKQQKEKYPIQRLKALCQGQSGGTPSKANPAFWEGDVPWVSPKDMKALEIYDAEDHISEDALKTSSAPLIAENSILLVVRSGILQRLVPVAINRVPVSINQDMRAFTVKNNLLLPDFLAIYLQVSQRRLLNLVKWSTTVQSINKDELDNFPVPLPPLDVQREIAAQVQAQRAEIARLRTDAERKAREIKADVEALILGTKRIEEN